MRDPAPAEHLAQQLRLLDRDGADEHRPAGLVHLLDLVDDRLELALLVAKHEVRVVVADHRLVGRDGHDLQLVDLRELLGLGHRRAGHPGQLVVQPEVVLERDRGQGHRLTLDAQALLRLDRLVEALGPASAGHLATRELVDDHDLAVLDDVVAVELVQGLGPERLLEVAGEARIGVVQVRDAEPFLHLVDALFGRRDGSILEVDEVVAAFLLALWTRAKAGREAGEGVVQVGRFLGLATDDQRCPGLVDEDVVDLVDDREVALALHPLLELDDHVVAQVVEPELVVRAVRHVRGIGIAALDRAEVDEPLVGGRIAGFEDVARVVGDDPDADPEGVEHRTHPLGVAPGEVVVDGHDVNATAGQRIERGRQGRHERLALAGPHLRDPALVEDDAAHQLDVEVVHAEGSPHGLARSREDVRQDVVEGLAEVLELALVAGLRDLAPAFGVGVLELILGRFLGLAGLDDLGPDLVDPGAQLVVGQGPHLGFELVRPVHERLDAFELALVRVDEPVQEAKHGTGSIGEPDRAAASGPRGL